ncbi:MAG: OmpA family protein [Gammaproteobacteria bacterium]
MKLARTSVAVSLVALAVIASPLALAHDPGWYVGFNVGQSRAKIGDTRITNDLLGAGFSTTLINNNDRDIGYKIFGGYQFNRYFALEAGYFNLGNFGFTATTLPPGTLHGTLNLKGINADAVGMLPITKRFSAFGEVGLIYEKARDSFTGGGSVAVDNPGPSNQSANYEFGVGLQYDVTSSIGVRAEADRYRINDAVGNKGDIDLISLGLVYRFGEGRSQSETVAENTEPTPSPAPVQAPAPVETQQYCSTLSIQFEVNLDKMQRQDKQKLDVVGTFLNKYPRTTAVIKGYTDNVGTAAYNLKLSRKRAKNVVNYLVTRFGIARSRLTAVGYGEAHPIGNNRTGAGKRLNRRIVAVIPCVTNIAGLKVAPVKRVTLGIPIEFGRNQTNVRSRYRNDLRRVAYFMKVTPAVTATVEGNTDNLEATPALAMKISRHRAESVVNYLVDQFGVSRSRLHAEGFGQSRRFAYNAHANGRQENRRVNIVFNYGPTRH